MPEKCIHTDCYTFKPLANMEDGYDDVVTNKVAADLAFRKRYNQC